MLSEILDRNWWIWVKRVEWRIVRNENFPFSQEKVFLHFSASRSGLKLPLGALQSAYSGEEEGLFNKVVGEAQNKFCKFPVVRFLGRCYCRFLLYPPQFKQAGSGMRHPGRRRSVINWPIMLYAKLLQYRRIKRAQITRINFQQTESEEIFPGFYNRKGFIISQHPLESTVSALWQLVAEQDVQVLLISISCFILFLQIYPLR